MKKILIYTLLSFAFLTFGYSSETATKKIKNTLSIENYTDTDFYIKYIIPDDGQDDYKYYINNNDRTYVPAGDKRVCSHYKCEG